MLGLDGSEPSNELRKGGASALLGTVQVAMASFGGAALPWERACRHC